MLGLSLVEHGDYERGVQDDLGGKFRVLKGEDPTHKRGPTNHYLARLEVPPDVAADLGRPPPATADFLAVVALALGDAVDAFAGLIADLLVVVTVVAGFFAADLIGTYLPVTALRATTREVAFFSSPDRAEAETLAPVVREALAAEESFLATYRS
jgi:hypothetical protein